MGRVALGTLRMDEAVAAIEAAATGFAMNALPAEDAMRVLTSEPPTPHTPTRQHAHDTRQGPAVVAPSACIGRTDAPGSQEQQEQPTVKRKADGAAGALRTGGSDVVRV